jgi:hypothetical protein
VCLVATFGCGNPTSRSTAVPNRPGASPALVAQASLKPVTFQRAPAPSASSDVPLPQPAEGDWATQHPLVLEAVSTDGSWVVACQARVDSDGDGVVSVRSGLYGKLEGDRLASYLLTGPGPGEPIDALLAFDRSGRFLVTETGGEVWLRDLLSGTQLDLGQLGADTTGDAAPYLPHRALSFDALGQRLLYLRRGKQKPGQVVLRELETGHEVTVDPGPGEVWRASLDPSGRWVLLDMLVDDTNGNGRLDWPVPPVARKRCHCAGPVPNKQVRIPRGDRVIPRVASSSGGAAEDALGLIGPLGPDLVLREPGGRVVLRDRRKKHYELGSEECALRILHLDRDRGLVLGVCSGGPLQKQLLLLGRGVRVALGLEVNSPSVDAPSGDTPRLFAVYPGRDAVLVDLDQKTLYRLSPEDSVLGVDGPRALVRRQAALWLLDMAANTTRAVTELGRELGDWLRSGTMVAVGPWVVDVRTGRLLGKVARRPLAVARSGYALVALGQEADAQHLAVGPLRWVKPELPSSTRALPSLLGPIESVARAE